MKARGIPIIQYSQPNVPVLSSVMFVPMCDVIAKCLFTLPPSVKLDRMWNLGWYFRSESQPRPNWSAFMQEVSSGSHPPPADIRMLPIIDLNPGDRACILSTLLFIDSQAQRPNIQVPCVTFDQPL